MQLLLLLTLPPPFGQLLPPPLLPQPAGRGRLLHAPAVQGAQGINTPHTANSPCGPSADSAHGAASDAYLICTRAAQNGSLTLLHLRLSEFVVERGARAVSHADVYHKLKRPDRFEWIRARPQLLLPREGVEDPQSARPRCEPLRRRYKRATKVEHCCETWTWCDYLSNS